MKLYRIKESIIEIMETLTLVVGSKMTITELSNACQEVAPIMLKTGAIVHCPTEDGIYVQIDGNGNNFHTEDILKYADEVLTQEEFDAKIVELDKVAMESPIFSQEGMKAHEEMMRLKHFANELIHEKVIEAINNDGGGSKPEEHEHNCKGCGMVEVCPLPPAEEFRNPEKVEVV